ncbi:MAG: YjbQ family protein [Bacteroidetes bacterium]|jgi:secondary thiamine-phosphate synthase enzyme|nr:YjbQ family protein [Bacteroidota bacterium]
MVQSCQFELLPRERGFHLITDEVERHLPPLFDEGLLHLFICHTSAGISLNENADPDVRHDFPLFFDRIAPEHLPGLRHTMEGPDDMPAHIKASLLGHSVSIPIRKHQLFLGRWQGVILGEFRNQAPARTIVGTMIS